MFYTLISYSPEKESSAYPSYAQIDYYLTEEELIEKWVSALKSAEFYQRYINITVFKREDSVYNTIGGVRIDLKKKYVGHEEGYIKYREDILSKEITRIYEAVKCQTK